MAENPEPDELVSVDELTPEEANRIIHSHRKVRYGTACWPCRQRKVKCDNKQPCENCAKREHPQLCSYKPNRSSANKHAPTLSQNGNNRKRAHSFSDGRDESRKTERQESWPRTMGALLGSPDVYMPGPPLTAAAANLDESESMGDRYLGQNSIPALLREQSSSNDKSDSVDIRRDMRSILGLDTSAPFPLMSSQHLHKLAQDISAELPSDREVVKLFRTYKEIPQPFWGFVYDMDDLESKLMVYLEDRSRNASSTVRSSRPVTASWLAILFAVLAVGSQYHESPYHIRTRDSQKYIQISFHFLRVGNFLLRPSFDSIQALLLTSFVLLNDMKAEASWALTGLTCRLAQSLGLHRPSPYDGRESVPPDAKTKEMIRRKLWWTCVWHDTLTSLSFDRCPMTSFPSCAIPISSDLSTGNYSYLEMMYHLIEIISRRLNPDVTATSSYSQIVDNCEAVEALRSRARAHMMDKEKCKTALDRLQYYDIRLHTSFVISVACRPALKRDCNFDPQQKKELADRCKDNLTETVRMFLAMHQLSVIPTRSWAFTYHGLSSALLLGILCETKTDPEIRQLQGDLIAALSATAAKEESSPEPHVSITDKDIELSGPLWRALTALRNIYDHGSVVGSNLRREGESSASGSGSRTPLPPFGSQLSMSNLQLRNAQSGGDPREDAALAMAEMQNGSSLQDFAGIPYTQPIPANMGLDGSMPALSIDQTQYMAPMDLYDSIWGESPDPFNSGGMDNLNFDFLAQPPPGQPQQQFYF
ncbi:putative transcriptional regulatory protein [Tolypocladium ophioglossoides CBS 100239]|uniref:Putative transcriptional regulatory protein n=1 Tax=Tolypocladium ophioglossoides (strain CBS 100239) TaxID=1163406 RepID=A0A0L0MYK9_TOLOC|nr:putative transcriptional regulatory protein [Tolypocladium ophioglossoides CBS 100239]